ncbi:MAG: two-component regulator propeller domain-containing protein, partial [Mucilaginibacter sp.]
MPFFAGAANIRSIGVPYVQNYAKSTYQAGNQNWAETKDGNGIMYFANSEGLLSFDGRNWQLYKLPNGLIVRAVAADGHGKIYTGAFGEIGYWQNNKNGVFTYTSLVKLIPNSVKLNEEVWKIYIDKDRIIFQSFGVIYIYRNGKVTGIREQSPYLFLLKAGNRYLVEKLNQGLYELGNDNKLTLIPGSPVLQTGVLSILPFDNTRYIIATSKNGLYLYDGKTITPWKTRADGFLKSNQLNNGVAIPGNYFAFGTILNGIIIIDAAGNVVQHINKSSGLQNNTVLSLYLDNQQNLWAGLDNGVDRIEVISPLYFYFDKGGKFGTVYSSIIYNNKIYLGTNQGLFYSDWVSASNKQLFQSFDFKFIPGTQGQVWDLSLFDGKLLCGHNDGTFQVNNDGISKISTVSGGWIMKRFSNDLLIQGTYTGFAFYRKDAQGNWLYDYEVKNFLPSRYIEPDGKGNIWVSHAYKGIYKITLSSDGRRQTSLKYYDENNGLPGSYNINVFKLNERIIFSSNSGFYVYDDITDKFFKYQQLNAMLGSFASSNKIIPAAGKKYWFIDHGRVALADFSVTGKLRLDSNRFSILNGRMVKYYENISRINNSLSLISIDDGFAIYNDVYTP